MARCLQALSAALNLNHHEGLENIALLDVIEALETDTALIALHNLTGIVLEAFEGGNLILEDHDAVTDNADLSVT